MLLQGEADANNRVDIAWLVALLPAVGTGPAAAGAVATEFALQWPSGRCAVRTLMATQCG